MESLHLSIKSGKRGTASSHVDYMTRKGKYANRTDLVETGFGNMPSWAQDDPKQLWKASEEYERKNGSIYRAYTISLPNALSDEQLKILSRRTMRVLAGEKAFQGALHNLRASIGNEDNPHIHVMVCDRLPDGIERGPAEMFRRPNRLQPELGGCRKDSGGLSPTELRNGLRALRERVAETINDALETSGHAVRVDHRTLRERGIDRKAEGYLGPATVRAMSEQQRNDIVTERSARTV